MPHLTLQFGPAGPLLDVTIGVSAPREAALKKAGQPVPAPQVVRGLIDTGASISAIDPAVLTALSLVPTGQTTILTPSTGNQAHPCNQYDVRLTLSHPDLSFYISALAVIQSTLQQQGIQALLGRDILGHCLLTYDGKAGIFILGF
jgi:aspartyl protease